MERKIDDSYISLEDAAEYLNIKPVTLRKWIKQKTDIPAHQIGRLWKFKKSELDEWVKSKYFTEDGEANAYFWEMAAALYYNNPYKYEYEEVTDYEITFIKNINEGYTVFLVEFEPSGFLYGLRDLSFYSFLHHHPSPFKYLDIAPEDRYYVGDKLAARRGGYIVDIEEEAYVGRVYPVPENYEHKTYVWDYDTTWWIQLDEEV